MFLWITAAREARFAATVVALALAFHRLYALALHRTPRTVSLDFSLFYASSLAMRNNLGPYWVDLRPLAEQIGVNLGSVRFATYPPTFIWMMEPLTRFEPRTAYRIWMALSAAMLAASLALMLRQRMPAYAASIFAALAVFYSPVRIEFHFAQSQILLLFLLTAMMRAMETRRDALAGFILSLAVLLKAFPAFLFACFAVDRRWKAAAVAATATAAGFALTVLAVGRRALDFFSALELTTVAVPGASGLPIVGISGATIRMAGYVAGTAAETRLSSAAHVAAVVLDGLVLALTARAIFIAQRRGDNPYHPFGLLIAAMVLLVPNAWPHYMTLLLIPFAQLAIASWRGQAPRSAIRFAIAAYAIAEASDAAALSLFAHGRPILANAAAEGLLISTILSFVSAHQLVLRGPVIKESIARAIT